MATEMISNLKTIVRGVYDIQKLRQATGNRIVINFKCKLGIEPGSKEPEESPEEAINILDTLRKEYRLLTAGVVRLPRKVRQTENGLISTMTELILVDQYFGLESSEARHFKQLEKVLADYPIWTDYLKGVKGVGPAMASVMITEFDIHKAKYSSSMWKYAGLDVVNGAGRSRKKEHLVESSYLDKDGVEKTKQGISFNPFLKSKLVGVLGSSFLRAGALNNPYRKVYDDYRHRLDNMPAHEEKSKGHKHNMAIRYMIKMFIIDLYTNWKAIEGLPAFPPYHETKLGLNHACVESHGDEVNHNGKESHKSLMYRAIR